MRTGQLKHRVTLEVDQGTTRNAVGEHVAEWVPWAYPWAAIEPLAGRELEDALQVSPRVSGKATIRYRAGVTPGMRLLHRDRVLQIEAVLNEREEDVWLVLLTSEVP